TADAVRRLRAERESHPEADRCVWIAVAREGWDGLSRAAFETAAVRLGHRIAIVDVAADAPLPVEPDAWRRALWIPCGTLAASVRFYEAFGAARPASSAAARERARDFLASPGFGRFLCDPTGDAPLPMQSGSVSATRVAEASPDAAARDPGTRIDRALAEGDLAGALEAARRWIESEPRARPAAWFSVSALLAARVGERLPSWLAVLEAEREISGGPPRAASR